MLISEVNTLFALIMAMAGVMLLYFRWCRHTASQQWWTVAGWLLIALATLPWTLAHGIEFAVMYAFLVPGILAWVFVGRQWFIATKNQVAKRHDKKPVTEARRPVTEVYQLHHPQRWLVLLLRTAMVLPYAGAVSLLATVALTDLLPLIKNDTLVLALLAGSLVWGIVASWLLAQTSLLRPVAALAVVGLLSALYLFG
ncbi:hypothetical protein [Pseudohongiella nitratireducens]|uniref:hypothetical protein n=1 Tax=Pseudohongiella nitratireducens TaxID=1768907 RepID=UPI0012FE8DF0|nr:hypothetical protein [Pseudohongiella nitratireducens]